MVSPEQEMEQGRDLVSPWSPCEDWPCSGSIMLARFVHKAPGKSSKSWVPLQCPEQDSRAACSSPNLLLQGCAILGSPFSQTHLCLGETPATD